MIGPMLTGLLITWLIVSFGWRAQFYALGVLAVVLPLPLAYFLLPPEADRSDAKRRHAAPELDDLQILVQADHVNLKGHKKRMNAGRGFDP